MTRLRLSCMRAFLKDTASPFVDTRAPRKDKASSVDETWSATAHGPGGNVRSARRMPHAAGKTKPTEE
jgi:hypothetical protein